MYKYSKGEGGGGSFEETTTNGSLIKVLDNLFNICCFHLTSITTLIPISINQILHFIL